MKKNYSIGITPTRVCKDNEITKGIVEGAAYIKYVVIWRYVVKLKRVCIGNTTI